MSRERERPVAIWSFLQYKKGSSKQLPVESFLHSSTQIGSKILFYGGCDMYGEPQSQLFLYDTQKLTWSTPTEEEHKSDCHPGARYGHTAVLVGMHPPKVMIYGGIINAGTFEFDAPDSPDDPEHSTDNFRNPIHLAISPRQGRKMKFIEEKDDSVYFLELQGKCWSWAKPLIRGTSSSTTKPETRIEHTACKTSANEVAIFGGWTTQATNDLWSFNINDMEWKKLITSGIQPRPRYRHTAEVTGNKMYILGGSDTADDVADGSAYLAVHELCLDTMSWTHPSLSGPNPFPRSGHASSVVGSRSIAVFGGKRSDQVFLNDLVILNLSSYTCTVVNTVAANMPTPVSNSTMSAIGNKCFVFGGIDSGGSCYGGLRELDIGDYLSSNDVLVAEGLASDYSFKILIIGDAAVGKSAILTRFSENMFLPDYMSTIGIDFHSRLIRVDKCICKLEIWDTAGQERFATITANYYRGAQGCLVVYDVGERDSFDHAVSWYKRAVQLGGENLVAVLIGNKCDLSEEKRQVSYTEGDDLAKQLGIPFLETSALSGDNVETAFVTMSHKIKASMDMRGLTGVKQSGLKPAGGVVISATDGRVKSSMPCQCG